MYPSSFIFIYRFKGGIKVSNTQEKYVNKANATAIINKVETKLNNRYTKDEVDTLVESASGSGHTIENSAGIALTQRDTLQFKGGLSASDDSTNEVTVVTDEYPEIEWSVWNAMTPAEQAEYPNAVITNAPGSGGGSNSNFVGTRQEWEALSSTQQNVYDTVDIIGEDRETPIPASSFITKVADVPSSVMTVAGNKTGNYVTFTIDFSTEFPITGAYGMVANIASGYRPSNYYRVTGYWLDNNYKKYPAVVEIRANGEIYVELDSITRPSSFMVFRIMTVGYFV